MLRLRRTTRGCGRATAPAVVTPDGCAFDGEAEALNEIAKPDSAYYATVIQSWDDCGGVCVNEIFNALKGGTISSSQIYVPGILVTKKNVADIQSKYPELFEK